MPCSRPALESHGVEERHQSAPSMRGSRSSGGLQEGLANLITLHSSDKALLSQLMVQILCSYDKVLGSPLEVLEDPAL